MTKVSFRQKANEDLNKIWIYTQEKWSENQADEYYAAIKHTCIRIGQNPNVGKQYLEISSILYGYMSGKHIIFYQIISEKEIVVIRILHERMDLKNRITE